MRYVSRAIDKLKSCVSKRFLNTVAAALLTFGACEKYTGPTGYEYRDADLHMDMGRFHEVSELKMQPRDPDFSKYRLKPFEGIVYIGVKVGPEGEAQNAEIWEFRMKRPGGANAEDQRQYREVFRREFIPAVCDDENMFSLDKSSPFDSTTVIPIPVPSDSVQFLSPDYWSRFSTENF